MKYPPKNRKTHKLKHIHALNIMRINKYDKNTEITSFGFRDGTIKKIYDFLYEGYRIIK